MRGRLTKVRSVWVEGHLAELAPAGLGIPGAPALPAYLLDRIEAYEHQQHQHQPHQLHQPPQPQHEQHEQQQQQSEPEESSSSSEHRSDEEDDDLRRDERRQERREQRFLQRERDRERAEHEREQREAPARRHLIENLSQTSPGASRRSVARLSAAHSAVRLDPSAWRVGGTVWGRNRCMRGPFCWVLSQKTGECMRFVPS